MKLQDKNTPRNSYRWAITVTLGTIGIMVGGWLSSISQVIAQRGAEPGAIVFENDKVLVRHYLLQPGLSTGAHSHGRDYLRVILQGGMLETTALNGSIKTEKLEVGTVVWRTKATHSTKNIGGSAIEGLVIEIK